MRDKIRRMLCSIQGSHQFSITRHNEQLPPFVAFKVKETRHCKRCGYTEVEHYYTWSDDSGSVAVWRDMAIR